MCEEEGATERDWGWVNATSIPLPDILRGEELGMMGGEMGIGKRQEGMVFMFSFVSHPVVLFLIVIKLN